MFVHVPYPRHHGRHRRSLALSPPPAIPLGMIEIHPDAKDINNVTFGWPIQSLQLLDPVLKWVAKNKMGPTAGAMSLAVDY